MTRCLRQNADWKTAATSRGPSERLSSGALAMVRLAEN
jgi:hypothetical protein